MAVQSALLYNLSFKKLKILLKFKVLKEDSEIKQNGTKVFIDFAHTPEIWKSTCSIVILAENKLVFGCGGQEIQKKTFDGKIASKYCENIYTMTIQDMKMQKKLERNN